MTQFKLDENLPADLSELLRAASHDAITVNEQGLGGAVDPHVAEACRYEGRVLLTLDLDFADIRAYPPERYAGLVVLRLAQQDKRSVGRAVQRILPLFKTEPLAGNLWVVDEHSVRIRGGATDVGPSL